MSLIGAVLIARQVMTIVARIVDIVHDEKADNAQIRPLVALLPDLQHQLAAALPDTPPPAPDAPTPATPQA